MKLWIMLAVVAVLAGCSLQKTMFSETVVGEDGNPVTTKYTNLLLVPPMGKMADGAGKLSYNWGGEENKIAVGQEATKIDNTGQAAVLNHALDKIEGMAYRAGAAEALVPKTP